jgi:hypothetical protein
LSEPTELFQLEAHGVAQEGTMASGEYRPTRFGAPVASSLNSGVVALPLSEHGLAGEAGSVHPEL